MEYWQNPAQDKIKDFYAACDVYLCASHSEGFGLPPLEAMACRCPVVSTRVGWPMEEIVDSLNGYLSPVGDAEALGAGLVKVLRLSDADWRKMSQAAYDTAGRYTWQDAGMKLERAMLDLIRHN